MTPPRVSKRLRDEAEDADAADLPSDELDDVDDDDDDAEDEDEDEEEDAIMDVDERRQAYSAVASNARFALRLWSLEPSDVVVDGKQSLHSFFKREQRNDNIVSMSSRNECDTPPPHIHTHPLTAETSHERATWTTHSPWTR